MVSHATLGFLCLVYKWLLSFFHLSEVCPRGHIILQSHGIDTEIGMWSSLFILKCYDALNR